jgi:hypothetical protein
VPSPTSISAVPDREIEPRRRHAKRDAGGRLHRRALAVRALDVAERLHRER